MSIRKLYVELTDRCNLNCTICYRKSWDTVPTDMADSIYEKLLQDAREIPTLETVVLGGIGEPTCSPAFMRALADYRAKRIILTTNGTYQNPAISQALADAADTVIFSVDGLTETFSRIRGAPLSLLASNIQALVRHRREKGSVTPQVMVQCVLSTDNLAEAPALVDFVADLGADGMVFSHLLPQTSENVNKILYTRDRNSALRTMFQKLSVQSFHRGLKLVLPHGELKTERFCSFIEDDAVFVSALGDVIPCYRLSHSYSEYVFGRKKQVRTHAFGNLAGRSLQDIWRDPAYVQYRERVLHGRYPSCMDCDLVDGCDYATDSEADCWCNTPSCADCLWSRRIVICP